MILFSDLIFFKIFFHELGLCPMYLVIAFIYLDRAPCICSHALIYLAIVFGFVFQIFGIWLLNFFLHQFRIAKITQSTCVTSIGTRVFFLILWHRTFGEIFWEKKNFIEFTLKKRNSQIFVQKMTRFVEKKSFGT